MYLKNITISNFRGLSHLSLDLQQGLNILIGENNAGKTAIIDALRICLNFGNIQRDKYFNKDFDFFIDKNNIESISKTVQFDLFFEVEELSEVSIYRELLNTDAGGSYDLQLHFKYYMDKDKLRYKVWGGSLEGQQVNSEVLQLINYVHLDALRDAEQHLRPYKDSKISNLYDGLKDYDNEYKKSLSEEVSSVMRGEKWKDFIDKGKGKINEHLNKTTFDSTDKKQKIEVTPTGFEIRDILNSLRIQIPIFDESVLGGKEQKYLHLSQNGLGYNNLIYISTILGDIVQQKENEKSAFFSLLVEEPEAHLHPQLQSVFFNYLNTLAKTNKFQIFVTSHSPSITAKADPDTLIVLQSQNNKIEALPILKSNLTKENKIYLHKFLDVTKSQLFFSNGTILVEGIAEALLLPVFAKIMGKEYDLDKNGIEVVITGTAFEHFAKLYTGAKRLASRCAILTDSDRDLIAVKDFNDIFTEETNKKKRNRLGEDLVEELEEKGVIKYGNRITTKINSDTNILGLSTKFSDKEANIIGILKTKQKNADRARKAKELESDNLRVELADITFEYDFVKDNEANYQFAYRVFHSLHPNIALKIKEFKKDHTLEDTALFFLSKITKSEFSYELAIQLAMGCGTFTVPNYIQKAIKWVVKGE